MILCFETGRWLLDKQLKMVVYQIRWYYLLLTRCRQDTEHFLAKLVTMDDSWWFRYQNAGVRKDFPKGNDTIYAVKIETIFRPKDSRNVRPSMAKEIRRWWNKDINPGRLPSLRLPNGDIPIKFWKRNGAIRTKCDVNSIRLATFPPWRIWYLTVQNTRRNQRFGYWETVRTYVPLTTMIRESVVSDTRCSTFVD